jgi:protein-S-isoprenylcysteine O-methyltransferase Ste14
MLVAHMSLLGRAPIHPVLFVIAKAALVPPHILLGWAALYTAEGWLAFPRLAPVAWLAVIAGLAVAGLAILHLGDAVRVGLPDDATTFSERGLYRVSRNPIYAGLFLSMIGSCVLVPNVLNLSSTAIAMVLHHRIVLAEERFLEARFGQAWRAYRARVRRYC